MATNPEESDADRQRRELEEIRRKFAEVGERLGSAFEPTVPSLQVRRVDAELSSARPPAEPTRPRWPLVVAVALIFLLGTALGYALPHSGASEPPASPATTPRASASTTPPQDRTPTSVPEVCLDTARKADQMIYLFTINDRSRRLAEALKAYTLASQACRKEASP